MQKRAAKDEKKVVVLVITHVLFAFKKKSIYESKWFIVKWVEAEEEEVKCLLAASAFYPANK